MKKSIIIGVIALCFCIWWILYTYKDSSTSISGSSELGDMKTELQYLRDTIDVLDLSITELHRDIENGDYIISSSHLDSLKEYQQLLWKRYNSLRNEMVSLLEGEDEKFSVSFLVNAIKKMGILHFFGILFLMMVFVLVFVRKRKLQKQAIYVPSPKKGKRPSIRQTSAQRITEKFKQAVHAVAAITKQHEFSNDHEEQIPVTHLDLKKRTEKAEQVSLKPPPPFVDGESPSVIETPLQESVHLSHGDQGERYGKEKWEQFEKEKQQQMTIVKLARKGSTSSEISKRLKLSKDEVELVIRSNRENSA